MNLTPTESERLSLFTAAELARRYRSVGVRLSHPKAVALISDEILTGARRGMTYAELVDSGRQLHTGDDVEPGVETMIPFIAVEACFAEGTKLVVVFDPVKPGRRAREPMAVPGEIIPAQGDIVLNAGRRRASLEVLNTGDRATRYAATRTSSN